MIVAGPGLQYMQSPRPLFATVIVLDWNADKSAGARTQLPSGIIRERWNGTEKTSMAPAQGRHAHIEKCKQSRSNMISSL